MKRTLLPRLVGSLLLGILLLGCFRDVRPYEFRQPVDQIARIEICRNEYDTSDRSVPKVLLKTLEPSEHWELVDAVQDVPGNYLYTNSATGIGLYQIRILYKDGESEEIGAYSSCYTLADGTWGMDCYMFDVAQFHEMLSSFLGETVTPTDDAEPG